MSSLLPLLVPPFLLLLNLHLSSGDPGGPYPNYCSKTSSPSAFTSSPRVPPLPASVASSTNARILSSSVVIRHGARTPYEPNFCWDGYQESEDSVWDCKTNVLMSTAPTESSKFSNTSNLAFEKVYEAPMTEVRGGEKSTALPLICLLLLLLSAVCFARTPPPIIHPS